MKQTALQWQRLTPPLTKGQQPDKEDKEELLISVSVHRALPATVAPRLLSGADVTYPRQAHARPLKASTYITYTLQPL